VSLTLSCPGAGLQVLTEATALGDLQLRRLREGARSPLRQSLALGRGHHRRGRPPAGHPVRLTSRNSNHDAEGGATRARGIPPTRRDSRAAGLTRTLKISPGPVPQPATS
jgi:hypothetical protein